MKGILSRLKLVKTVIGLSLAALLLTACTQNAVPEEEKVESASKEPSAMEEDAEGDNAVSETSTESEKTEISMEEAIALGMEKGSEYYENLFVTEVHSYDNDYERSITAGTDGKRQWWYVDLANEDQNYVSILIKDGKIDQVEHYDNNGNSGLIDLKEVTMTSEEAARKAKELGLKGGDPSDEDDWVSGYNFKLSYASLADTPDEERIFLEVIGISPNGNFAHIDFDASTGEVLLSEEKIENSESGLGWVTF